MKLKLILLVFSILFVATANVHAEESCVFIFPGYESPISRKWYQKIGSEYQKKGITPSYIEIDWSTENIQDYVAQARENMIECDAEKKYFYGFSLGALIALALAAEETSASVVVSSVAPFFKEDIERRPWYSFLGLYYWWLFGDSESVSERNIISSINSSNTEVVLLVGSEEDDFMLDKAKSLAKALFNAELVIMKGIEHSLSQPGHLNYIVSKIRR